MFEWNQSADTMTIVRLVVAVGVALLFATAIVVAEAAPGWAVNHCSTQIKAKKTANASGQIYLPSGQPTCSSAAVTATFEVSGVPYTMTSNYSSMAPNATKSVNRAGADDSTTVKGCSVNAPVSCTWSSPYMGTSWWTHN